MNRSVTALRVQSGIRNPEAGRCRTTGLSAFGAITAFGIVVAGMMWMIKRWHEHNLKHYPEEVDHLLQIARHDDHH